MTGFGIGQVQNDGWNIKVELRSVNNRFFEVSCKLPAMLSYYERCVKNIIRNEITRGKIYVATIIKNDSDGSLGIRVNRQMTKAIFNLLKDLRDSAGLKEELKLEHFLKFSEIFEPPDPTEEEEKLWELLKEALLIALKKLKNMRNTEGETLAEDLQKRILLLKSYVKTTEEIADKNLDNKIVKMKENIKKLIADIEIDEDRLQIEIALMSNKIDITEECVRLGSHYNQFTEIVNNDKVIGKKLNFLLQEMNREVNTISSKSSSSEISHIVVNMKEEIEKIREQVQNLE